MLRDSWRVSEKLDCPSNYRPHSRPRGQLNITGVVDGNITKSAPVCSTRFVAPRKCLSAVLLD